MDEQKEYPITIHLHSDTGIPPVGIDFYYEAFPNAIVGYRGSTPYRFNYNDVTLIVGPETPADIMNSVKRLTMIQKYEYVMTIDKRALEFASFLDSEKLPVIPKKHDNINYG